MRWFLHICLFAGCDLGKAEGEEGADWSTDSADLTSPPGLFDSDGGPSGDEGDGGDGGNSIRIEPPTIALSTDGTNPATTTFTAFLVDAAGGETAASVSDWGVSDTQMGTIDSLGQFESTTHHGGSTTIFATVGEHTGSATLTLQYDREIIEGDISSATLDAFKASTATSADTPQLLYPLDDTTLPKNLNGLAFAWSTDAEQSVSELHLQTATGSVRVFTDNVNWQSDTSVLTGLSGAGDSTTVDLTIRSAEVSGGTVADVFEGPSSEFTVTQEASGSVVYWTSNYTDGIGGDIMRIPFGAGEAATLWGAADAGGCVGCHTPVEASDKLVVTHSGVNGNFSIIDVSDPEYPETLLGTAEERRATFHAASPDGEFLLTINSFSAKLYSLSTGSLVMEVDTDGERVSHPDWSPDGASILLVRVTSTAMNDMNFEGGEIIKMSWDGSTFGAPETLISAVADENFYAPRFSPDGEWIAYNRAIRVDIASPDGSSGASSTTYANPSSELWIMDKNGGQRTRLDNANQAGNLQRSMPRWAPQHGAGPMWLTFSSKQSYPLASRSGLPQIWVSAIDTAAVGEGSDPSSPAFWLPGQDSSTDNHLPVWWSK